MAKYCIEERIIWFGGKLVPVNDAKINILSPTSQFGVNVFEGIRCYWNENERQLFAFRLPDHYRRLKQSQKLLRMENKYTEDQMQKALVDTIMANEYKEDIAVRQTLFLDGFGSWSSHGPVSMFVSAIPKATSNPEYNKNGLNCCVCSWQRINDNSLSPRIKCGANYINSRMAQLEAVNNGYDTAIFLNNRGSVSEGPGSCLFLVRNHTLITPLLTDSVLESITRDTVITLAKEVLGLWIAERTVDRTELYLCEEAFLCGSAMGIAPVLSVDKYRINAGKIGEITGKIQKEYLKAVTGRLAPYADWLTPIYDS